MTDRSGTPGDRAGRIRVRETIGVQYLKYPDTLHWRHDPMVVLGTDEHGLWLGGGPTTFLRKGLSPTPRDHHERGFFADHHFVQLVVPDGWWTFIFNGPDRPAGRISHYVDIVTPPEFRSDEIRWVDLDLDVILGGDGELLIDDEDEFTTHIDTLGYPPMWVDRARAEAARIFLAIERGDEPFSSACLEWWRRHTDR